MTPKEKALELCNKFLRNYKTYLDPPFLTAREEAKENALIAVDEILSAHLFDLDEREYWITVKQEIERI